MTEHIFIFAKIQPKAEYFEKARKAIQEIVPLTRDEPGCVSFTLHQDSGGSLYLYEEWLDDTSLDQHYQMDYTKAVFKAYESWLAGVPEITQLTKIA